ncbi:XcyI family restriction endonuclease [Serratia marcescens]|uniref:XcyI family restriction endonuclease n=1 Tax=Serratia marcescens TaxID=615 RepID=A0A939SRB1_SERMA|nr:XcyI family restriction endonuclease [Serratia marcescens]
MTTPNKINFPPPKLQIDFAFALKRFRAVYLQSALLETVRDMDIAELDKQLAEYVPGRLGDLRSTACGLNCCSPCLPSRGESLPAGLLPAADGLQPEGVLRARQRLRCRLLQVDGGKGKTSKTAAADLPDLCVAFCATASALLAGVGLLRVSRELLDDLTPLTVGPQLRGGANNQRGTDGIVQVFEIIREIVAHAAAEVRESAIEVNSATGRPFLIEFAPDPDIIIREEMEHQHYRNVVAIEVKSGTDVSNIHNRIGEAEPPGGSAALPSAGRWSMSGGWTW